METIKNIKLPDGNTYKIGGGLDDKITNCITEIPQDIKLELKDGVLTLKAGSKVYVPNGFEADGTTPKFDEVTIESDLIGGSAYLNDKIVIFVKADGTGLTGRTVSTCESGSSHSLASYYNWYDTTNHKIGSYDGNGELEFYCSLPVAVMTDSTSGIVSIDQTFNGFGYIGSTVFVTKGVKGLIPNGRNEDGSLNNIEVTTKSVLTYKVNPQTTTLKLMLNENGVLVWWEQAVFVQENTPNFPTTISDYSAGYWYKPSENKLYYHAQNSTSEWVIYSDLPPMIVGVIQRQNVENSTITSLTPKLPFRAVDYNDKSEVSGWGMPSDKYIDLTLGTSGTKYTAPANGWFYIDALASSNNAQLGLYNSTKGIRYAGVQPLANYGIAYSVEATKGDVITIVYGSLKNTTFRFVYAQGEV
jgi:hypothetical protein